MALQEIAPSGDTTGVTDHAAITAANGGRLIEDEYYYISEKLDITGSLVGRTPGIKFFMDYRGGATDFAVAIENGMCRDMELYPRNSGGLHLYRSRYRDAAYNLRVWQGTGVGFYFHDCWGGDFEAITCSEFTGVGIQTYRVNSSTWKNIQISGGGGTLMTKCIEHIGSADLIEMLDVRIEGVTTSVGIEWHKQMVPTLRQLRLEDNVWLAGGTVLDFTTSTPRDPRWSKEIVIDGITLVGSSTPERLIRFDSESSLELTRFSDWLTVPVVVDAPVPPSKITRWPGRTTY